MNHACQLCRGACCESITLAVNATDPDTARWIDFHGTRTADGLNFACACSMLKDGLCSIYSTRPKPCADYQVGSDACRSAIARRRPEQAAEILELI